MIKYYPQDDNRNSAALGIKFPMNGRLGTNNSSFFSMSYTTEEQAITNYKNLLLTRKGERYMQPEYGIGIQDYLFEQNTEILRNNIENEIRRQAEIWLPYIFNKDVDVRERANIPGLNLEQESAIQIVITFSVTEQGANQQIVIFQVGGITNINLG